MRVVVAVVVPADPPLLPPATMQLNVVLRDNSGYSQLQANLLLKCSKWLCSESSFLLFSSQKWSN